jgi:hypothetical protein
MESRWEVEAKPTSLLVLRFRRTDLASEYLVPFGDVGGGNRSQTIQVTANLELGPLFQEEVSINHRDGDQPTGQRRMAEVWRKNLMKTLYGVRINLVIICQY